jgi:hypothetical protein
MSAVSVARGEEIATSTEGVAVAAGCTWGWLQAANERMKRRR